MKSIFAVLVALALSSVDRICAAESQLIETARTNAFESYPWSETTEYVRVAKSLLQQFSIPSVTTTNLDTMEFVLTDEFTKAFRLTPKEVSQVTGAIANALHAYRTAECKHYEPTDPPARIGRGPQIPVAGDAFHFRLTPFSEEAAAIRKKLDAAVLDSIGEERSKYLWENGMRWMQSRLDIFPEARFVNSSGIKSVKTYTFSLPASAPGRVDWTETSVTGSGGGSGGRTYGEALDRYAPESIQPRLAQWRKAARDAKRSEKPSSGNAPPFDEVKAIAGTANPVDAKKVLKEVKPQPDSPKWDNETPFVDLPKSLIPALKIPGLTIDEKLSPESAALFGLSAEDMAKVHDIYFAMKSRFEKLERAHFERTQPGQNTFVLKPFPEKSAVLKQEWVEKLTELVGRTRGELLDQSMRTPLSTFHLLNSRRRDLLFDNRRFETGQTWLHRGTTETKMTVTTGVSPSGRQTLGIDWSTSDGACGSGGVPGGIPPDRWKHLLTPEVLGLPLTL